MESPHQKFIDHFAQLTDFSALYNVVFSALPFLSVTLKTVFTRYVPLSSLVAVLVNDMELPSDDVFHSPPTVSQTHKYLCFSKDCVISTLDTSLPSAVKTLVQVAVLPETINMLFKFCEPVVYGVASAYAAVPNARNIIPTIIIEKSLFNFFTSLFLNLRLLSIM